MTLALPPDIFKTDAAAEHEVLVPADIVCDCNDSGILLTILRRRARHFLLCNSFVPLTLHSNGSGDEAPGTSTVLMENVSFNTLDSRLKVSDAR